jgi:hypothetical protein
MTAPTKRAPYPKPTVETPDIDQLEDWLMDGDCEATDGCIVEMDGTCEHGHLSWARYMGLI